MTGPYEDRHDFRVAGWLVQPSLGRLTCDGGVVRLRPQLMDLLACFAARAGRTVTRQELLATIWSGRFVADSGLPRCVAELRQALGDSAREPRIIETIPKRGYRLIAPVAWETAREATAPCGAPRPSPLDRAIARLHIVAMAVGGRWRQRRLARSVRPGGTGAGARADEARAL